MAANQWVLAHEKAGETTQEGMRFLPAGAYRVRLHTEGSATVENLVVRAIPELIFCKFQYDPFISPHGPYDWAFVQKHIAANVNCLVGSGAAEHREFVKAWRQQGKRWLVECGVPALDGRQSLTAEEAYAYWTQHVGFTDALLEGVIADEFLGNGPGMKYMSLPTAETLNINPAVDYKVWMDMQFQLVATDPAFEGLYGLMEYTCGYADEETVRWAARLYRHYGIEGNTAPLSRSLGFKYRLQHIINPDFAEGTKSWALEPAEPGSVEARTVPGYGWLQGRYPRTPRGDTLLWTKRSDRKPNWASQTIRNLESGKLYSLKLITADYRELQQGKSAPQKQAVSIELDNVSVLPGRAFTGTVFTALTYPDLIRSLSTT